MLAGYEGLTSYFGDIHNHCDISYGHGSLEDALANARLQLDFTSVTAHAHWPDLPETEGRLAAVNAYHREGFLRALEQWPRYRDLSNAANAPGSFVTFLSFEWHSLRSGDHNVYFGGDQGEILPADDLEDMRARLRQLRAQGVESMLIPHHIGYLRGYRGINWAEFTPEFSPFVEIFSMHGAAESDDAPFPYLHTMGPRHTQSTMQHGLATGHMFGVVASTDSHSAHPGSYGHGRLAVWAHDLSRERLWQAMQARRVVALTGDNIRVAFAINGSPMGSDIPFAKEREIAVAVTGGGAIDYVEVVRNNRVLYRWDVLDAPTAPNPGHLRVTLEIGWAELDEDVRWDGDLRVTGGRLLEVEPRFRGRDIVSPQHSLPDAFHFSHLERVDGNRFRFSTRSWKNPTIVSPGTQAVSMVIAGDAETRIEGMINGQDVSVGVWDLLDSSHVGYLGGFLTPAFIFHRATPEAALTLHETLTDEGSGAGDTYYVRVRQRNGQWAWTSPIRVGAATS